MSYFVGWKYGVLVGGFVERIQEDTRKNIKQEDIQPGIGSLYIFILLKTSTLVACSVHDVLNMLQYAHI
ncbi:hypothetical protein HUJ05_001873 [Dendroctonus ponderosae]|nr:hypothetical protein HUJ05_001873 [Dendroctonus ponderosae]